jgi:TetR/AcrR family transcriptional repressor of mexCD-oprJ operon
VLEAANAALNEVDFSGDPGEAFACLVDATWQVTLRSGNLIIAADKALSVTTVRQAHTGGLEEERVRRCSPSVSVPVFFAPTSPPIG